MTAALTPTSADDASEIDLSSCRPLLLMLTAALGWLAISDALALVNLVQWQTPAFLADSSMFTYGRTHAMQEIAFLYGWASNVGFAVMLWILGRLGGKRLRMIEGAFVGAIFWNLGVCLAMIGIAVGDDSSIGSLHLPRYVQTLFLVASIVIALPGMPAWRDRRHRTTFAAQWYAAAGLFLFPCIFAAAQIMLAWAPARGVLQPIAASWYMQNVWSLWLAPSLLAVAYYLGPKITGHVIPNYEFSRLSFWTLIVVGGWSGGRHLSGGPVPAWIASVGVASCMSLVFHYVVTAINLRFVFASGDAILRLVGFGVVAYVIGGLADAVTSLRTVSEHTQFTWFAQAQSLLARNGAFSLIFFGAIYFIAPRLTGRTWPSHGLRRFHQCAAVFGAMGLAIGFGVAGLVQARDLANASISFVEIAERSRIWLQIAATSQALVLLGNTVFFSHIVRLVFAKTETLGGERSHLPQTKTEVVP